MPFEPTQIFPVFGYKIVDNDGNLHLPNQEAAPKLTLWRAPTDNDAIGTAHHKWINWGLRNLKVADCKVKRKYLCPEPG